MISKIKYYVNRCTDPHYNLAVEQYLLENVQEGCCILYLWQNKNTVVIGRNQNAWKECRTEVLGEDGGVLARRLSGGGAVYHDLGNLNFTFLVPTADYDLDKQLGVIMEGCRLLGISTERSGRNDLLTDGRKFSGNAFYEQGKHSYHHGTLLVDVDMNKLSKYLKPSKAKLTSKGVDSVRARVINLKELKGDLTIEAMRQSLLTAFQNVYGLPLEEIPERELSNSRVTELYGRNISWEWNFGRRLPFSFQCSERFSWGEIELQLQVDEGRINAAGVYSDAMEWGFAGELESRLIGKRFSIAAVKEAVDALSCSTEVREDIIKMLMKQEI
jgi:lipoate-protein ligase A